MPFDWQSPIGYTVAMCMQIVFYYIDGAIFNCPLILFIGICMFLTSFADDMKTSFYFLNNIGERRTAKRRSMLKKKFHEIAFFHAEAIQLSN